MGIASETLANINREQWEDYKNRFVPLENELMNAYNNPVLRQKRMDAVTNEAIMSADTAQGVGRRTMARYGQSMEGQQGVAREAGLTKTSSIINAQNTNRQQMNSRDLLLLSGGLTSRGI